MSSLIASLCATERYSSAHLKVSLFKGIASLSSVAIPVVGVVFAGTY